MVNLLGVSKMITIIENFGFEVGGQFQIEQFELGVYLTAHGRNVTTPDTRSAGLLLCSSRQYANLIESLKSSVSCTLALAGDYCSTSFEGAVGGYAPLLINETDIYSVVLLNCLANYWNQVTGPVYDLDVNIAFHGSFSPARHCSPC